MDKVYNFYERMLQKGEDWANVQQICFPLEPRAFSLRCDTLCEIHLSTSDYPTFGEADTADTFQITPIHSERPVGFESDIPLPNIFERKHKPTGKVKLTVPQKGILQDKTGLNLSEIVESILEHADFRRLGGILAYYRAPTWEYLNKREAPRVINHILQQIDPDLLKGLRPYHIEELYRKLDVSPIVETIPVLPPPDHHILCCSDGMYDWSNDKVLPLESKYLRFSHLNISASEIFPQKTYYFDLFLENIAQGNTAIQQLILEVMGVIISGYPVKKFFVFQGVSNSGKSQLAKFLQDVLGETACAAVNNINQLGNERVTGQLPGKLLLVCSDVPDEGIKSNASAAVKQLTGDDPIYGDPKYERTICFINSAKLLFLSNFPLQLRGNIKDHAFYDRMIVVPFRFSVPSEQRIESLHRKLFEEVGGIAWKALEALRSFEKRGNSFTEVEVSQEFLPPPTIPAAKERILTFVQQCCVLDQNQSISTTTRELYFSFLEFDRQEYPESESISDNIFSRTLNQCSLPIQSYRTAEERGYRGIGLKSSGLT